MPHIIPSIGGLFAKARIGLYRALRRGNDRHRHLFRAPHFGEASLPSLSLGLSSYRVKFRKYLPQAKIEDTDATWTNLGWVGSIAMARDGRLVGPLLCFLRLLRLLILSLYLPCRFHCDHGRK